MGEPCKEEHGDGDAEIGGCHVDPDVQGERLNKNDEKVAIFNWNTYFGDFNACM